MTILSAAARRGLLAFDDDGCARRSNNTDAARHRVYWQTITKLERVGLCEHAPGYDTYQLTDAGRVAVASLRAAAA